MISYTWFEISEIKISAVIITPLLAVIVFFWTDATVTSILTRLNTLIIVTVSISSIPFAIGINALILFEISIYLQFVGYKLIVSGYIDL